MGGCLSCDWVAWKEKQLVRTCTKAGLESKQVIIDDGLTSILCWVPTKAAAYDHRPAIMFIHGFQFDGKIQWEFQIRELSKYFRVYVPDLIFFGGSYSKKPDRTEAFQAECFKKMLDELKVDRVHVVGTSYGGMVGYLMAFMFPNLVDKLVCCSSGITMVPSTNDRLLKELNKDRIHEVLVPTNLEDARLGMDAATVHNLLIVPLFFFKPLWKHYFSRNMVERNELLEGMITGSAGAPPVPKISQKTLISWGTKDRIFSPYLAEELKEHIGENARITYFKNCGHSPQIESYKKFNSVLLDFLHS